MHIVEENYSVLKARNPEPSNRGIAGLLDSCLNCIKRSIETPLITVSKHVPLADVLNVDTSASIDTMRSAWKVLQVRNHPDKFPQGEGISKFSNTMIESLSNPDNYMLFVLITTNYIPQTNHTNQDSLHASIAQTSEYVEKDVKSFNDCSTQTDIQPIEDSSTDVQADYPDQQPDMNASYDHVHQSKRKRSRIAKPISVIEDPSADVQVDTGAEPPVLPTSGVVQLGEKKTHSSTFKLVCEFINAWLNHDDKSRKCSKWIETQYNSFNSRQGVDDILTFRSISEHLKKISGIERSRTTNKQYIRLADVDAIKCSISRMIQIDDLSSL